MRKDIEKIFFPHYSKEGRIYDKNKSVENKS